MHEIRAPAPRYVLSHDELSDTSTRLDWERSLHLNGSACKLRTLLFFRIKFTHMTHSLRQTPLVHRTSHLDSDKIDNAISAHHHCPPLPSIHPHLRLNRTICRTKKPPSIVRKRQNTLKTIACMQRWVILDLEENMSTSCSRSRV